MQDFFSSDFTLGILGGGQLGKMLLYETRKFDVKTHVLDPSIEAPSRLACDSFFQGDLQDYQTVYDFGKKVDVLTYEIESVNLEALLQLEKEGKKVYPSASTLQKIQNKATQKAFYKQHNIPTAPFKRFDSKDLLLEALDASLVTFPFVWKSGEGGYDGKGVSVIKTKNDLTDLPNVACIAEDLIDFKLELAVIVVRNPSGDFKSYPVVEMEFHPEANQVEYVICPARIPDAIAQKAQDLAKEVSKAFDHVGVLAIEMFLTHDDQVLVNEVAPRTHNSGHFTIEGSFTNQFEQHLRSVLDLPLGDVSSKLNAVMVNLVGSEGYNGAVSYENLDQILQLPGVIPHIYGKKETRPFRKMGHVTIVHSQMSEARALAQTVKSQLKVVSKD